jgi:DNA repair exonuclease SbcCD nuclease subunit
MSIKTIVHVADIHFRTFQRHLEFRSVCEYFIDKMKALKPDRIVIAGDIVHSRNQLTPELVKEVSWFLESCTEHCGKVVIIPGNHDIVEQNKERMDAITPIVYNLGKDNIVYYKESGLYQDENVIWTVFSIYNNSAAPTNLHLKPYTGTYIGLYHGVISGAIGDNGYTFAHGAEISKFDECDLTLCGDIHKRQIFKNKNNKPIIMVGSLIQQNYGETINEHGYAIIDIDTMYIKFHDIDNTVKYLTFKISDIDDIDDDKEVLING